MKVLIYVKTNRTQKGYAKAEIGRFRDFSNNKICYSFKFYQTYRFFDTYKELKNFTDSNYELLHYEICKGMAEFNLPENENEIFKL